MNRLTTCEILIESTISRFSRLTSIVYGCIYINHIHKKLTETYRLYRLTPNFSRGNDARGTRLNARFGSEQVGVLFPQGSHIMRNQNKIKTFQFIGDY